MTAERGDRHRLDHTVLIAIAVVGILTASLAILVHPVSTSPPTSCPSPSTAPFATRSPIQHVFFLIKENHAFENYFGTLRGALGSPPTGNFRESVHVVHHHPSLPDCRRLHSGPAA